MNKIILTLLTLVVVLPGCGVYQIMGPRYIGNLDEFASWADDRWKVEDWARRCTSYSTAAADYGWITPPDEGNVKLTKSLAMSLWKHKRGACGQYAAMFVYCGRRHDATCGFIHVNASTVGGHMMAWIEEPDGTISRTDNKEVLFKEHKSKQEMINAFIHDGGDTIIYDSEWNVIASCQ